VRDGSGRGKVEVHISSPSHLLVILPHN